MIEDVIKFREKTTLNDIIDYTKLHLIFMKRRIIITFIVKRIG